MAPISRRQKMEEEAEDETEFKDDFADEFEEEQKTTKKPIMVQKKQPQKVEFEEEQEEEPEVEEEEPKIESRGRPKGSFKKPQIQGQKEDIEEEYSVYNSPERHGIKNRRNESVGEDTLTLLALVLNKLRNLEVGLLGEK